MFARDAFLDKEIRDTLGCDTLTEWREWVNKSGASLSKFIEQYHPDKPDSTAIFLKTKEIYSWLLDFIHTKDGLFYASQFVSKCPEPVDESPAAEEGPVGGISQVPAGLAGLPPSLAKALAGSGAKIYGVGAGGGTVQIGAGGMQIGGNISQLSGGGSSPQSTTVKNPNEPHCVGCDDERECDDNEISPDPKGWTFKCYDSTADDSEQSIPDAGYTWIELNPPRCQGYLADHYSPCEHAMLWAIFTSVKVDMNDTMESIYEVEDKNVPKLVAAFKSVGMIDISNDPDETSEDTEDEDDEVSEASSCNCGESCSGGGCGSTEGKSGMEDPVQVKTQFYCPSCGKKSVYQLEDNNDKCLLCGFTWKKC